MVLKLIIKKKVHREEFDQLIEQLNNIFNAFLNQILTLFIM